MGVLKLFLHAYLVGSDGSDDSDGIMCIMCTCLRIVYVKKVHFLGYWVRWEVRAGRHVEGSRVGFYLILSDLI